MFTSQRKPTPNLETSDQGEDILPLLLDIFGMKNNSCKTVDDGLEYLQIGSHSPEPDPLLTHLEANQSPEKVYESDDILFNLDNINDAELYQDVEKSYLPVEEALFADYQHMENETSMNEKCKNSDIKEYLCLSPLENLMVETRMSNSLYEANPQVPRQTKSPSKVAEVPCKPPGRTSKDASYKVTHVKTRNTEPAPLESSLGKFKVQLKNKWKREHRVSSASRKSMESRITIEEQLKSDHDLKHLLKGKTKRGLYRCSHCPKSFSSVIAYARHMDEAQIDRPEKCPIKLCPWKILGFNRRTELRRHCIIQHPGSLSRAQRKELNITDKNLEPMKCPYGDCDKTFYRKDSYNRHISLVHINEHSRYNKRLACGAVELEQATPRDR